MLWSVRTPTTESPWLVSSPTTAGRRPDRPRSDGFRHSRRNTGQDENKQQNTDVSEFHCLLFIDGFVIKILAKELSHPNTSHLK